MPAGSVDFRQQPEWGRGCTSLELLTALSLVAVASLACRVLLCTFGGSTYSPGWKLVGKEKLVELFTNLIVALVFLPLVLFGFFFFNCSGFCHTLFGFLNVFIHRYFGCAGSWLLWRYFSTCERGASYCGGFSCCRAWALGQAGHVGSAVAALEHRISACGAGA